MFVKFLQADYTQYVEMCQEMFFSVMRKDNLLIRKEQTMEQILKKSRLNHVF